MNVQSSLLGFFIVAAAGTGTAFWLGSQHSEPLEAAANQTAKGGFHEVAPTQTVDSAIPLENRSWDGVELPPAFFQKLPPNSRVEMYLDPAWFKSGIKCPGAGYLPLLNGVPFANQIGRAADDEGGPVPPVVAKKTGPDGIEWYEHADGSVTSTHFTTGAWNGVEMRIVATDHVQGVDESYAMMMGMDGTAVGRPPGEKPPGQRR